VDLIWRWIPEADFNMEADFEGGLKMEAGLVFMGVDCHMECIIIYRGALARHYKMVQ
jgi:hypothetical protein